MLSLGAIRQKIADKIYPEGRERRDTAERLALTDDLTGLANRRAFDKALKSAERDASIAIISFDLNHFKLVNDKLGHTAGDAVLRDVANCLKRAAGRFGYSERVFRLGGDEFGIIAPASVAEGMRDECEAEVHVIPADGMEVTISGTVGQTYEEADNRLQARKAFQKSLATAA
jgi:diguanylate cyclase (GGDEF)-like protein